ncbi:MAG: hypothetical protein IT455_05660 [Planctomycetes bacterium]|nr:hypothetical protein [Planctomycetota bacterium]
MSRILRTLVGAALLFVAAVPAQTTLQTTFAHNTLALPGSAIYFDLDVQATPITLVGLDLNLGGSGTVEIYTRAGTRVGNQTSAAGWSLATTAAVVGAVAGQPHHVDLTPLVFAPGVHGIAVRATGLSQYMTIVPSGGILSYGNPELTVHCGESALSLFSPLLVSDRVVNARLFYLPGAGLTLPPAAGVFAGASRGYRFTAPSDFNISRLGLPPAAFVNGCTASYLVRINDVVAWRSIGNAGVVTPQLRVGAGDVVDVIGNWTTSTPGGGSARNTTAAQSSFQSLVAGTLTNLSAVGWSWDIGDPAWTTTGATGTLQVGGSPFGLVWMTTEPCTELAANTVLGHGCGVVPGSCYQLFQPSSTFDLANSALTLQPQPGGGYSVSRLGALLPVGATGTPTVLNLIDDGVVTVPFTTGAFPGWTGVSVCSNGFVSRPNGNGTAYSPSAAAMLNATVPAFWSWHDYDPTVSQGGRVKVEQNVGITVVTWDGVWDFGGTTTANANTLQFQLYANGTVTIVWGSISGLGNAHLVGYSPGGPSPDLGPTDFSALGGSTLPLAGTEIWPLTLAAVNRPVLGTPWNLIATNLPAGGTIGIDVFGLSDPAVPDLAAIGMPGCNLRASLDVLSAWGVTGSSHPASFLLPNQTSLRGVELLATTIVFSSQPVNAFGAVTSNAVRGHLGDH